MKAFFLLIIFFILVSLGFSQNESNNLYFKKEAKYNVSVDSLEKQLLTSSGKERVDILIKIANEIWIISPEKALEYANSAYTISKSLDYQKGLANALNALGLSNYTLSRYEIALKYHSEALEIAMKINDNEVIASVHNYIGMIYWKMNIPEKAINSFQKYLDYSKIINNKDDMARSYNNLGLIYSENGDPEIALDYFDKAYNISEELSDNFVKSSALTNKGVVYSKMHEYEKALDYYFKALKIYEKEDNKWLQSIVYNNLGYTYNVLNNEDSAIFYARKGLDFSLDLGMKKQISQSYHVLAEIYKKQGRFELSLNAFEEYMNYNDSAEVENNFSLIKMLDEMNESNEMREYKIEQENKRLQMESEERKRQNIIYLLVVILLYISGHMITVVRSNRKKNKLNKLLAESNKQLQELNNKLQESEKELVETNHTKDTLFSVIGHDLRSPFNSLIGFSELLFEDYEELDDATRKRYISEINMAGIKTFQLLENLLQWTRLQSGKSVVKPELFKISEVAETAVSLVAISASHKGISITNMIDKDLQVFADKNMVSTVFRNLLSNSVKFTGQNGYVYLSSFEDKDFYRFSVKDTGTGMSEELLADLFNKYKFSSKGTSGESGTGLGLGICAELLERQGGKIWAESELGTGSTFFFTVPKSN